MFIVQYSSLQFLLRIGLYFNPSVAAADVPALEAFGAPAGKFIDGVSFDPGHPNAYLEKFAIGQQSGTSAKPTNDKAPARKVATP